MIDVKSFTIILAVTGLIIFIFGSFTLSYIIHQTDVIDDYVNKINSLEEKNKELERNYKYEKNQAEYWYYYSVNDAC